MDVKNLSISKNNLQVLKQKAIERLEAVINYAESKKKCRNQILLAYFGETDSYNCNQCDICLEENKKTLHVDEFEAISRQVKELLSMHPMTLSKLINALTEGTEDKRIRTIQWLLDNNQLKYKEDHIQIS